MKILVIDGQGGKMGRMLVEQLRTQCPQAEILAVGTNSIATAAMLKAGADAGATGENPVAVLSRDADVIVGPLGIVLADSLLGEVTPAMAVAVGRSSAHKVLIPVSKCGNSIAGAAQLPLGEYIRLACEQIGALYAARC